ncbi:MULTISPECIES: signal peptidase I [unclassified Streptomyces]|uniref:signal peptidase I n=1 Tax=unclassified Streptomyces TaxID=2593676 RepID=UPI00278BD10E|nr:MULTISPECIES: signal peptidase I [unclassified Streptomyces]
MSGRTESLTRQASEADHRRRADSPAEGDGHVEDGGAPEAPDRPRSSGTPSRKRERPLWKRLLSALATLLTVALIVGVAGAAAAWKLGDYRYVPILTNSMAPGMPKGSMAITQPISPGEVREGMVIAFLPPEPWTPDDGNPVVHRVEKLTEPDEGKLVSLETKGDNNEAKDPWKINLNYGGGTYAEVVEVVPKAGTAATELNDIGLFGVGALLFGFLLFAYGVRRLWALRSRRSTPT